MAKSALKRILKFSMKICFGVQTICTPKRDRFDYIEKNKLEILFSSIGDNIKYLCNRLYRNLLFSYYYIR